MTDDELWSTLRSELATTDVDAAATSAITRRAHDELRHPKVTLATIARGAEGMAVTTAVIAQLAWAWSVVLR
jgi:hypothetical protein